LPFWWIGRHVLVAPHVGQKTPLVPVDTSAETADCCCGSQEKRRYLVERSRSRHASRHKSNEKLPAADGLDASAAAGWLAGADATEKAASAQRAIVAKGASPKRWNVAVSRRSGPEAGPDCAAVAGLEAAAEAKRR